ncbi:phosphoinositide 3-kinase regulatory subunit 6 [Mastacembelus armatus]|uniref:Phosphoinositide-3-kinase, regulatory subunit 6b n=1 Tax=Mastacembelus armatus TaxID=205130 RepID=A0A3Q3LET7_9TELE|nr:phosphoinositide 3-kinase regulatory subunit 6-like [Mastacembelus armatus]
MEGPASGAPGTMCDPTADQSVESDDVRALLKEMNRLSVSQKGLLRWTLEKKVELDPSSGVSLIGELVKELEKKLKKICETNKTQPYKHIIPMLHTLCYVVVQSGSPVPQNLYQTVCQCLMKLLILPVPYSTVALSMLGRIKMEMTTPGFLYQRRIIAEQNLKNKHFTSQEKVFVLADPAVFSAPLEAALKTHLEASSSLRDTPTVEKNLLLRVLRTGLGAECHGPRLAQALEALDDQTVEEYFQRVVADMKQSVKQGEAGSAAYMNKLQHIHRDILTAPDGITTVDHSSLDSTVMPFPQISFLLWEEEEDLWNLLADLTLRQSCSVDEEENKRDSVLSQDSGIDVKDSDHPDPPPKNPAPVITRRNAFRSMRSADRLSLMQDKMFLGHYPVLHERRKRLTARVLVMGDDRVLGRLSRAYHSIRETEAKLLIVTKKLNLQFYYVPVTDLDIWTPLLTLPDSPCQDDSRLSLAFLLGRVDPWYNGNVNSLGATISKLPVMSSNHSDSSQQSLFLLDNLCYYLRYGTQPVNLPLYSVKMTRSSSDVVKEVFVSHLEASIPEFRHLKEKLCTNEPLRRLKRQTGEVFGAAITVSYTKASFNEREVKKGEASLACGVVITSEPAAVAGDNYLTVSFDSVNPGHNKKIRTQKISIRTVEHRTLSVCLDQDPRRTYTDIQRIEICPCSDPGCSINNQSERPLSRYLDKVLSLPINTFTGAAP